MVGSPVNSWFVTIYHLFCPVSLVGSSMRYQFDTYHNRHYHYINLLRIHLKMIFTEAISDL